MFNKKAQAAMEFLMTYGWAIMIVLIGIGALFFLGVFNPSTPSVCNISSPFICQDVAIKAVGSPVNNHAIILKIAATGLDSATISNINANGVICPNANIRVNGVATQDISGARNQPVEVQCFIPATGQAGTKVSGTLDITWVKQFGVSHLISGTYSGTVEAG